MLFAFVSASFAASGANTGRAVSTNDKPAAAAPSTATPPAAAPATAKSLPAAPKSADDSDPFQPRPIVGLWHVIDTADLVTGTPGIVPPAPPSYPFLESYKMWHRDGIEFEQAFKDPKGGNYCFGVWEPTGDRTVKLHHLGVMFNYTPTDPDTDGTVKGIFTQDETDEVAADGQSYKGTFTFKVFPPTDVFGTGPAIVTVTGTIAATRINVD